MRRRVVPELLDADRGSQQEVRESLHDLDMVNRRFGGVASYVALLRRISRLAGRSDLSLLDVAAGTGFVALHAAERLARENIQIRVTLQDRAATHLPSNGVPIMVGDALCTSVPDNSYDVVSCSLFVHHLEPREVRAFAREALRVARLAVVISDTIRSPVHLLLTYAGWLLFRSRLSRHDGPASVRRSYTVPELRDLLRGCGARDVEIQSRYLYRMGVVLWK